MPKLLGALTMAVIASQTHTAADNPIESKSSSSLHGATMHLEASANHYYENRDYAKVISMLESLYPFGESSDDLEMLRILGQSYYAQGDFDLALRTFQRFLDVQEKLYASSANKDPFLSLDRVILAGLYAQHSQIERAEGLIQSILAKQDSSSKAYRATQSRLAHLYLRSKSYQKAVAIFEVMLRDAETRQGLLSPQAVSSRKGLSGAYIQDNRRKEGESLYLELLRRVENSSPAKDDLANALGHLARFYVDCGDAASAEAPLLRALSIQKGLSDQSRTGVTLENLQILYEKLGALSKISTLFEDSLTTDAISQTSSNLRRRAVIFARSGNFAAAEQELSKLIASLEKEGSEKQFEIDNTLYCLGQVYVLDGKYAAAEPLFERVYEGHPPSAITYEIVWGAQAVGGLEFNNDIWGIDRWHNRFPTSCHFLGWLYFKEGKFAEAASMYGKEIERQQQANTADYKTVGYSNALAWIYVQQHKFNEAIATLNTAVKMAQKSEPNERFQYESLLLRGNLALVLEQAGRDPEPVLIELLHKLSALYYDDPVPDFGIDDYGEYDSSREIDFGFHGGVYKTTSGESRVDAYLGSSSPPLVAFSNGALGAKDNTLFPGEGPRSEGDDDYGRRPQLEFLEWIFSDRTRGAEGLEILARIRLGDVYCNQGKCTQSEEEYDLAIAAARKNHWTDDVLAVAYEHKATLLQRLKRDDEAKELNDLAKDLRMNLE